MKLTAKNPIASVARHSPAYKAFIFGFAKAKRVSHRRLKKAQQHAMTVVQGGQPDVRPSALTRRMLTA